MSATETAALAAAAVLMAATAVVAALETVVTQLDVVRALRLEVEGRRGARALLRLVEHRARTLDVTTLVTVTLRVTTTALLVVVLQRFGVVGIAAAVVGAVVLGYTVAEVLPRALVQRRLERAGLALARLCAPLVAAVAPVAGVLVGVGRGLVPPAAEDAERPAGAPEDEEEDGLEPHERAMIRSIFELGDTRVREIMVPRPDMVTVRADAPFAEVVDTIVESGFSRIPVTGARPDDIIGVVYAKDVLERLAAGRTGSWRELVRPATFVPESKRVDDLLRELQSSKVHLAIVVDEYGATVGLVTIEDILEEIVGEIVDEHDREEPLVEVLDDERIRVDGRLPVDDLNELFGSALPTDGWDTVGGLLLGTLGRVPRVGEQVTIEGLRLTTERVQGRRISKVLVERVPVTTEEVET